MNNQGQVTIFVILALVIVIFAAGYFVFFNSQAEKTPEINSDPIYTFVQDCLETASEKAVINVGLGGGYFYSSPFSTEDGIAYYWLGNTTHLPSIETIEKELSSGISKEVTNCIENVSFQNQEVYFEKINVTTKVQDENVLVLVDFPIEIISWEGSASQIKDFQTSVPVRMGLIYQFVKKFVLDDSKKEGVCLSCIYDFSKKNNLLIEMFDYPPKTVIFDIEDNQTKVGGKTFEFIFANDYSSGI